MNMAHIHLMLNHIPTFTIPIALLFAWYFVRKQNAAGARFAYGVLFVCALTVYPVYFTGEEGEDAIEKRPEASHELIEEHEEAAELALVLTLLTAGMAGLAAWKGNEGARATLVFRAVAAMTLVSLVSLGYTANLGGQIRRPELRAGGD